MILRLAQTALKSVCRKFCVSPGRQKTRQSSGIITSIIIKSNSDCGKVRQPACRFQLLVTLCPSEFGVFSYKRGNFFLRRRPRAVYSTFPHLRYSNSCNNTGMGSGCRFSVPPSRFHFYEEGSCSGQRKRISSLFDLRPLSSIRDMVTVTVSPTLKSPRSDLISAIDQMVRRQWQLCGRLPGSRATRIQQCKRHSR